MAERKPNPSEKDVKAPNIFERAKEEIEAVFHHQKSPRHTKETHGTSDDIDENTPIDEVKGPNVFERVKEEVEALVETIHHKKESEGHDSPSKMHMIRNLKEDCDPLPSPQEKDSTLTYRY